MHPRSISSKTMFCRLTRSTFTLILEASHNGARAEGQPTVTHPNCPGCGTRQKEAS